MFAQMEGHRAPSSDGAGDDGQKGSKLVNNMEVTHLQPQDSAHVRVDGLSAAVIQQTVNALPIQPDSITDIKGPVLKLKRVDSTSVDVRIVHSFTAHYTPKTQPCYVTNFSNRPRLTAPSPSSAFPALLSHSSPYTPHLLRPALEAAASRPYSPASSSPAAGPHHLPTPTDCVEDGIDCEPVVVEFDDDEEEDVRAKGLAACGCPGQGIWELDASDLQFGRRIGVGGFSEVFVAKYEGTMVAVKRLLSSGPETARQLCTEVSLLAQLRHPNLLLFMGYTTRPQLCIITEFMARGSLFQVMRAQEAGHPLEPRLQRVVAISVARGMLYLHTRSPPILHLDLKTPNILIDDRWRVKIADFGLSKVRAHSFVSSSIGNGAGTPEWMAPEMLRCEPLDDRADVYSFGVVLWELLTGEAPWESLNAMQVVGAVGFAGKSLPPPTSGDPSLIALCTACLAPLPSARPSFHQIVLALESHFAAHPLPPSSGSLGSGPLKPLLPAASAPPSHPSPHPGAYPSLPSHLQHALTAAAPEGRHSPARHSTTPLGRRRERSPDWVDESPPAITTRLANGAKHPSPRLPTPTDPTLLSPLTPLPAHGDDRSGLSPVPQSPRPRTTTTHATSHTHTQSDQLPPSSAAADAEPHMYSSLPTPTPPALHAPPPSSAPLPNPSPFAQSAHTPWGPPSLSSTAPQPPSGPDDTDFGPPQQPLTSPFAAYSHDPASAAEAPATAAPAPPPSNVSPFAAFASLPPLPGSAPFASPPHTGPFHSHVLVSVDSPLHSWLQQQQQPQLQPALVAEAAASSASGACEDDPMQADGPPSSPCSLSSKVPPISVPLCSLMSEDMDELVIPLLLPPTTTTSTATADASAPTASAGGLASVPPAEAVSLLTPFLTHQLSDSAALQEVVLCAPTPQAALSPAHGSTAQLASPAVGMLAELEEMPSMMSLDEKTRALLQCASNTRCYHTGRFRVTAYDLPETVSAPIPKVAAPAPVLGGGSAGGSLHASPSRECSMRSEGDDDADDDAAMQGSYTMYKRGRFFIKAFTHKARPSGGKPAVPKSGMLHTPTSGLVCTTAAQLHDAQLVASVSSARPAVALLRRTASTEVRSDSGCMAAAPLAAQASDNDDLCDQHSPAKTPRQHAAPAAPSPTKAPAPLLASAPRASLSPTTSANEATPRSRSPPTAPQPPGSVLLLKSKSVELPAIMECRQYHRGRFNVQENVVVKAASPPAPLPKACASPPAPSPRLTPPPSPRVPKGQSPPSCRQAGRFTILEQPGAAAGAAPKPQQSGASTSARPPCHKAKASPRAPAPAAAAAAPAGSSAAAAAVAAAPKVMGRFKVYEQLPAVDTPRPRRSPRAGHSAARPMCSPRKKAGSAATDDAAAVTAVVAAHEQVAAGGSDVAAAVGQGCTTTTTASSSSSVLGGDVECSVEVVCDDGCEQYSVQVDVLMTHGSSSAEGGAASSGDAAMAVDIPLGVASLGGRGGQATVQAGDEGAVSSLLHLDLAALLR